MKLINLSVVDFINELESSSPAPGGGSASALISTLSTALVRMVGNLTFGKKKYEELSDEIKEELTENFIQLEKIKKELILLIDKDTESFLSLMRCFKMPKETEKEKEDRATAIEKSTIESTEVPLKICELSLEILKYIEIFVEYGNQNAVTDSGVAALFATAGGKGAIYNVKINLPGIKNQTVVSEINHQIDKVLLEINTISSRIENRINEKLS